jgi:CheY-like chemotaxis protein
LKVLIAEDEAISRTVLQQAVERFGHESLVAEDGEKAWELFQSTEEELDVVISDWMMPGLDGPEVCRRVREEQLLLHLLHLPHSTWGQRAPA